VVHGTRRARVGEMKCVGRQLVARTDPSALVAPVATSMQPSATAASAFVANTAPPIATVRLTPTVVASPATRVGAGQEVEFARRS
jgi:hypothetical protein